MMAQTLRERQETYLCTGDNICLYCTDSNGFVFSDRTCSAQNQIYTYHGQDKIKPDKVPNPQVLAFQVNIQNRYKLGKKYRKLLQEYSGSTDEKAKAILEEASLNAEAEHQDNTIEQKRLHGKPLRYGAIIQLRHVFTEKYIHVDNTRTSSADKSRLLIHLQGYDGKSAQFRLRPQYKVNSEEEEVRIGDQVIFEGVKTPGQYLHASPPFTFGPRGLCSELNVGVDASGFTVIQRFSPALPEFTETTLWENTFDWLQGGVVVQIQHRHVEGYLSAEGVFVKGVKEGEEVQLHEAMQVHLRVREADLLCRRTLYPPSSCSTLWQVEDERSIVLGSHLRWEQHVRIRHLPTRMYLAVDTSLAEQVFLIEDGSNPRTVFRLHAKNSEQGRIPDMCSARIEHVLTGTWLHGSKDDIFTRKSETWIKGTWRKVTVSAESLYMDAFHIRLAPFRLLQDYNRLSGMLPLLADMSLADRQSGDDKGEFSNTDDRFHILITALREIADFLVASVHKRQNRRKLMREMQILDLLVSLLHSVHKWPGKAQQKSIFEAIYNIFYICIAGGNHDDFLYFAQHLDFFLSQIKLREGFGFYVTRMLVELIRDRRDVVERIKPRQIDSFISLLKKYQHHRYIQLLSALCVVDGLALPSNQSRICDKLIQKNKDSLLSMRVHNGVVMVSKRNSTEEAPLASLVKRGKSREFRDDAAFLEEQLILFQRLCHGRNQHCIDTICKDTETITWEIIMNVINSSDVTDDVKAQFLNLMRVLFIDVGENTSYAQIITNTFVYDDFRHTAQSWLQQQFKYVEPETEKRVPELAEWMTEFLSRNRYMVASMTARNKLILSVLRMFRALLELGFLSTKMVETWKGNIFCLMNGANDLPAPQQRTSKSSRVFKKQNQRHFQKIYEYRHHLRFEPSDETSILVDAKYEALNILDVLLTLLSYYRAQNLVSLFKDVELKWENPKYQNKEALCALLDESFTPTKSRWSIWDPLTELSKQLDQIFQKSEFLPAMEMRQALMDLARYKYPKIMTKALMIHQRNFTTRSDVIHGAQQAKLMQTADSLAMYKTCQTFMPLLHRLLAVKLYDDQMHLISAILDRFKDCCRMRSDESKSDLMGQQVLVAHGILPLLMSILDRERYATEENATSAEKLLVSNTLQLLQLMARGNPEVQRHLMSSLDTLLRQQVASAQLAETLKQILYRNASGVWKIDSKHVKTLVNLVSLHQDRVPSFVEVLSRLIVVREDGSLIRRSQTLVTKHFLEGYPRNAYVFEMPASSRRKILMVQEGHGLLEYFINLLNLLVYAAQGTRGSFGSFCQNVFPLSELLSLLANPDICTNLKRPLVRYLTVIYLQTADARDPSTNTMIHTTELWAFLQQLATDVDFCLLEMEHAFLQRAPVPESLDGCYIPDPNASMDVMHCKLFYLTDAIFDFLLEFSRLFVPDLEQHPEEIPILRKITGSLLVLSPMLADSTIKTSQYLTMRSAIQRLMIGSDYQQVDIDSYIQTVETSRSKAPGYKTLKKMPSMLDVEAMKEIRLNEMLRVFMVNCGKVFGRPTSVAGQLNVRGSKLKQREYASGLTGSTLPLEEGFQENVSQFVTKSQNVRQQYCRTEILLRQLRTSSEKAKSPQSDPALDALDVRCLQILRATLHNLIITLPSNWNLKSRANITRKIQTIRNLQDYYVELGLVEITFSLLNKQHAEILLEVLGLLCCLLFNANSSVQDASLKYFESTKEEVFFMVLIEQFQRFAAIIKERRAFLASKRKQDSLLTPCERDGDRTSLISDYHLEMQDQTPDHIFTSEEDVTIMLMVAVLGTLCDGQHRGMQDYLRYQPDNLRSFNLVAEATQFLSLLATSINGTNIELTTQLIITLNEMCQGNQENRVVTLESKVVDFLNSIMRTLSHDGCSHLQVLTLYRAVGDLIISLLEESSPHALRVAKEVAATIDVKAILRILTMCHETLKEKSWKIGIRMKLMRSNKVGSVDSVGTVSKYEYEKVRSTVLKLYIIVSRIRDVTPDGGMRVTEAEIAHSKALSTYKSAVATIEIVKDDHLQRVYFPIPHRSQIRNEVKSRLKWGIDRTSPTNKIRDFMRWSNAILKELVYNRKVLSNPISMFISSQWGLWNYAIIFLSLLINVIMLVTWESKASLKGYPSNATALPPDIDNPVPDHPILTQYTLILLILAPIHNAFSVLLLISYFLINKLRAPQFTVITRCIRRLRNKVEPDAEETVGEADADESVFSMRTVFVLFLVGASFAGTVTHGYFFAVHLLNIVNTNQLLKGVIKAVTQNGRSLIMVAILGVIFLYLYALIGFAFFRSSFIPDEYLYCDTLYECSVTIIRYGLIGDIDDQLHVHPLKNSFKNFGLMAIYQMTFFIFFTTIGLNIIFGIIVDTFSELRDLKWRAEKDMMETCFICNRQSYDFEHFSKGFRNHVKKEHNIWTYIHYFLYLLDTNPNEYTSLDAYVAERLKRDQYDFFPLNRALCLANLDEEMGETKLDTVATDVGFLVRKHNEEEATRTLQLERFQNDRWKEECLSESGFTTDRNRRHQRIRKRRSVRSSVLARTDIIQKTPRGSLRVLGLSDVLGQMGTARTATAPPSEEQAPPTDNQVPPVAPSEEQTPYIDDQVPPALSPRGESQESVIPVPESLDSADKFSRPPF